MAVVINELEVAPQPANEANGKGGQERQGQPPLSPEAMKTMEKTLFRRYQKSYRLETY